MLDSNIELTFPIMTEYETAPSVMIPMTELNIDVLLGDDVSFHDALIETIHLDYLEREAQLECRLFVGDPDAATREEREQTAHGRLTLTGLLYFVIEPPDDSARFEQGALNVSDDGPVATMPFKAPIPKLPTDLPEAAFVHCFYVNHFNAYIFVAATGARFEWITP